MVDFITAVRQSQPQTQSYVRAENISRKDPRTYSKSKVRVRKGKKKKSSKSVLDQLKQTNPQSSEIMSKLSPDGSPIQKIPPNTITAAPKLSRFQKIGRYLEQAQRTAKRKSASGRATIKDVAKATGAVGADVVIGSFRTGVLEPIRAVLNPIDTAKGIYKFATDKATRSEVRQQLQQTAKDRPGLLLGGIAGLKVPVGAVAGKTVKTGAVKLGSKRTLPQIYADPKDLIRLEKTGRVGFPTAKTSKEIIKQTRKGDVQLVTASTGRIKGSEAGLGKKGAVGLEDPGIFTTPKGKLSLPFLRLADDVPTKTSYTLNPISEIKSILETPTITRFRAKGVKTIPKAVTKKAGFEAVKEFFKTQQGKGLAFITKRSQIGRGEVARQSFKVNEDFKLPFQSLTVTRGGKKVKVREGGLVKKGDIIREAGTSEAEIIIGAGTKFIPEKPKTLIGKLKGFDEYTVIKGEAVPIYKKKLVFDKPSIKTTKPKTKVTKPKTKVTKPKSTSSQLVKVKKRGPVSALSKVSKSGIIKPISSIIPTSKLSKAKQSELSPVKPKPSPVRPSKAATSKTTSQISRTSKLSGSGISGVSGLSKGSKVSSISSLFKATSSTLGAKLPTTTFKKVVIPKSDKKPIQLLYTRTLVRKTGNKPKLFSKTLKLFTGAELR